MLRAVLRAALSAGAWRLAHGPHFTRYGMYKALRGLCPAVGAEVLAVSHSAGLAPLLGILDPKITEANYPEHDFADLKAFPDEAFDFVLSDQVLEHVEGDPQRAFDASRRVLRPGGIAVHTTCFINPIHGAPSDFWRFTPEGLRYLARDFAEIIACGGWGNGALPFIDWLGLRFTPVPHATWHPLHRLATRNDPAWPITTWIVARK